MFSMQIPSLLWFSTVLNVCVSILHTLPEAWLWTQPWAHDLVANAAQDTLRGQTTTLAV